MLKLFIKIWVFSSSFFQNHHVAIKPINFNNPNLCISNVDGNTATVHKDYFSHFITWAIQSSVCHFRLWWTETTFCWNYISLFLPRWHHLSHKQTGNTARVPVIWNDDNRNPDSGLWLWWGEIWPFTVARNAVSGEAAHLLGWREDEPRVQYFILCFSHRHLVNFEPRDKTAISLTASLPNLHWQLCDDTRN